MIQKYLAGADILTAKQLRNGDVNKDKDTDLLDAVIIQKYLAGFSTGYPVVQKVRVS